MNHQTIKYLQKFLLKLVCLIAVLSLVFTPQFAQKVLVFTVDTAKSIRSSHRPFSLVSDTSFVYTAYRSYYKLPQNGFTFHAGYISAAGYDIHVQLYKKNTKRLVLLLHGYLDHSALNSTLVRYLLEHDYSVAMLDLPGHGLSGGPVADIDSFSSYGVVVRRVLEELSAQEYESRIITAHSTGCAAALEYLYQSRDIATRYVFVSPLVRSYMWHASRFGMTLLRLFTDSIFRRKGGATSDKDYERFMLDDPMYIRDVPFHWVDECANWHEKIEDYPELNADLTVFQGTSDTVVDWKYNIEFLKTKVPGTNVVYIEKGSHSLQYERKEIRTRFYQKLSATLEP